MLVGVGSPKKAEREDPGVRAAKNSEFKKRRVMSTLNEPNWSMCSITLTYPARSHFQRTLNRERPDKG